jgi:hypothetical protein
MAYKVGQFTVGQLSVGQFTVGQSVCRSKHCRSVYTAPDLVVNLSTPVMSAKTMPELKVLNLYMYFRQKG